MPTVKLLDIDNTKVREQQIARLKQVRARRDQARVRQSLEALTQAARSGQGNLLELAVEASRARATVGEISDALETVFTRHRATIRSVSGVYGGLYEGDDGFKRIQREVARFPPAAGRRPRLLVVDLGPDGPTRGAPVVATPFPHNRLHDAHGPPVHTP